MEINKGFFVVDKQTFAKNEKNRHKTIDKELFEKSKEVKYIVSEKHIMLDADSEEAVVKMDKLVDMMLDKPYSYLTKDTPGDRHKHYWFEVDEESRFLIDKYKLNSSAKQLVFHDMIDTRAFNTIGNKTGAVYLKTDGKNKAGRPSPEELLKNINRKLPKVPLLLLLHKKIGEIPSTGNNWSNAALSATTKMKKDGWPFNIADKMFETWAAFNGDDHSTDEIKHKWEDAFEIDSNYEDWTKSFMWKKVKEKYMAVDIADFVEISKYIVEDRKLIISKEDGRIWGLNDFDEFEPIKEIDKFIKRFLIKEIGNVKPSVISNIRSYIEGYIPIKFIETNKYVVSFKNKSINSLTGKEYEIKDMYINTNIIPWDYVDTSTKEYEKERKFLDNIMLKWANKSPQVVKELYELIGLSMTKYMGTEKVYFLLGNGSNGKSWFLSFLIKILGETNVSNEDLKELSANEFSSSNLYGKLANINLDISSNVIEDTSLFKKIASGDRMSASFKGKDKFSFTPYALNVFGANAIPYTIEYGDSDAINRRIKIIPFSSKFDKTKTTELERAEMNEMLMSEKVIKVAIDRSMKAVMNSLNNSFTESSVSKKKLDAHKREMNHLFDFIEEEPIRDGESIISAHKRYMEWVKQYGYKALQLNNFVKKYENVAREFGITIHRDVVGSDGAFRHKFVIEGEEE